MAERLSASRVSCVSLVVPAVLVQLAYGVERVIQTFSYSAHGVESVKFCFAVCCVHSATMFTFHIFSPKSGCRDVSVWIRHYCLGL
jgi:hypothetical protein